MIVSIIPSFYDKDYVRRPTSFTERIRAKYFRDNIKISLKDHWSKDIFHENTKIDMKYLFNYSLKRKKSLFPSAAPPQSLPVLKRPQSPSILVIDH